MMRLLASVIVVIVCLASFAADDQAPLSLAEYKSRLEQYSAEIQKIAEHSELRRRFQPRESLLPSFRYKRRLASLPFPWSSCTRNWKSIWRLRPL